MISTTRFLLFCLLVTLGFSLCAQSPSAGTRNWQISAGAQYAQSVNTLTYSASAVDAFCFGANLEYVVTLPRIKIIYAAHLGFQQIRGEGDKVLYSNDFGLDENLRIDNIRTGAGLSLKLNNKGKYHPLLGAQAYLGFPVNSEYTFRNVGMDEQYNLPAFYSAKGGAGLYNSGHFFAGLERELGAKTQLRLKAALGQHYQYASWELPFLFETYSKAQLAKGGYWQASLEVVHRW
ncbi:hypothetical protein [Lewinella sp. LCG006]|uniref:hypothetical protein n=1 Tax=Lewinella sp. LCG006 TaxID=3231911 RepID=UPI003460AECA